MKPVHYYFGCMRIMWQKFRYRKLLRAAHREPLSNYYVTGQVKREDVERLDALLNQQS